MSFSHFCALFTKNIIILKRTYILTTLEIISPIIVIFLFSIFKSLFKTEYLFLETDENYIESNGTLIKDVSPGISYFRIKNDLAYRGIVHPCFDRYIALIGENFPEEIKEKLASSKWEINGYNITYKYFNDINDLNKLLINNKDENDNICFGISYTKEKNKYIFKLHYNASPYGKSFIPSTNINSLDPFRTQPDFSSYKKYIYNGFLNVQRVLYEFVLQKETNNPKAEITYRMLPQKYDKYCYNILDEYLNIILGLFILVAYAFPLSINIYRLIKEKESRAKEIMKMMGLNELNYFLPYFVIFFVFNFFYALCNAFIVKHTMIYLNSSYLFLFFMLYGFVIYSLVFFFQSFLEKSAISIIFCLIVYSIQFFLVMIFQENAIKRGWKIFFGILFPPINMQLGVNTFCQFQTNYKYIENNIHLRYNKISVFDTYIIFICNIFLYMFLGFYLHNVLPQKYGINHPLNFLFTKTYWGFDTKDGINNTNIKIQEEYNINNNKINNNFELIKINNNPRNNINNNNLLLTTKSNSNMKKSISISTISTEKNPNEYFQTTKGYLNNNNNDILKIKNIKKSFKDKLVLNNLSFNLYRNEIFVLLGHNGAGKTVLLNILTGLLKADSGKVIYNSQQILTSQGLNQFRKKIGICPQEDILFDNLTVEEHLKLFCKFKSFPELKINEEINKVLSNLNLNDKKNTKICNLSGGQKRKLSIALALVGESSIIFLDEPTSGMDITSRRNLWDILKRILNGKIIILTTHFMEEASILGNRVGILSKGKMKCIGSPLFLINKFTKNINLNITKKPDANDMEIINFVYNNINNSKINIKYEILNCLGCIYNVYIY